MQLIREWLWEPKGSSLLVNTFTRTGRIEFIGRGVTTGWHAAQLGNARVPSKRDATSR